MSFALTAVIAPSIWVSYVFVWIPHLKTTAHGQRGYLIIPDGVVGVVLCVLIGFMLAVLATIAILNRHRLGRMFRPTKAKAYVAGLFALVVPVGAFGIAPISAVFVLFAGLINVAKRGGIDRAITFGGTFLAILCGSFIVVSMIFYGIRHRGVRVFLLLMLWAALFAALLMSRGIYNGPL